jgi:hypothetical protein
VGRVCICGVIGSRGEQCYCGGFGELFELSDLLSRFVIPFAFWDFHQHRFWSFHLAM